MAGQLSSKGLAERILQNSQPITETGCLIWMGTTSGGYGKIRWKGKRLFTHRAIYEDTHGELPKDLCACHTCDTPTCVNPNHIFAGTRAQNNADKTAKGRQAKGITQGKRGADCHYAKLSEYQVNLIRSMHGTNQYKIAEIFNISQSNVSKILSNKSWSNK